MNRGHPAKRSRQKKINRAFKYGQNSPKHAETNPQIAIRMERVRD